MRCLDLTLPTPAENLALDEALLDEAETAGGAGEVLRLWEPAAPMVVAGRSSRIDGEVRTEACRALGIPVLRRTSGGAAVVAGPGCLMYALVLSYQDRPGLRRLDHAHRFVLGTMAAALGPLAPGVRCRGVSDLVVGGVSDGDCPHPGPLPRGEGTVAVEWKFSGNSVRCRRHSLLYHGTLLYDFPLELIERCLAMPPRQPDYRAGRPHAEFVVNLPLSGDAIRRAVREAWDAHTPLDEWPRRRVAQLVAAKYGRAVWNEEGREQG